jgi:hypothetical protein
MATDKAVSNLVRWVFAAMVAGTACAGPARAQPPRADGPWSGHVSCQVDVRSDGYAHQETQTWTLTGGPPTSQGIQSYPATWSTTGHGTATQTQGTQVVSASWKSDVAPTNTTIAIFVRASDQRLTFKSMHAQISASGGHKGTRQVSGGAATPSIVQYPAYEWPLPVIEDLPTATRVIGSGTTMIGGGLLPGHAPSGSALANCTWEFSTVAGLASSGLEPPRSKAGTPGLPIQIPIAPVTQAAPAVSKTAAAPSTATAPQASEDAALVQASPSSAIRGQQNVAVTLTGRSTHFDQQTTKVTVGAGLFVTVASVKVTSPTSLVAQLNLALTKTMVPPSGQSTFLITVTTGAETVQLFDALHVVPPYAGVPRRKRDAVR